MKFKVKKRITVEEDIDVDDRLYQEDSIEWQMTNMILNGQLDNLQHDLFHEESGIVNAAAERINNAFKKADGCLALVRSGKFEI